MKQEIREYKTFKHNMIRLGVVVFENEMFEIIRGGAVIELIGSKDPALKSVNYDEVVDV